jgi:hypothetical protein
MVAARGSLIPILLGGAVLIALSCRDASPVGVDVRTPALPAGTDMQDLSGDDGENDDENEDSDSLVSCRPLPYDSVTRTIGRAGGVIEVRRNWLVILPGALSAPVTITAVAPSDTLALVRFQPQGLTFQKAAFLVVKYDNCRVPRRVTPRIALVTDALDIIEYLAPVDASIGDRLLKKGRKGRYVIGQLQHFSNYAVAW